MVGAEQCGPTVVNERPETGMMQSNAASGHGKQRTMVKKRVWMRDCLALRPHDVEHR